jgi:uncharacterized OB-fold protein
MKETEQPEKRPDRVLGGAHSTFWEYCARDELWMQQCRTCSLVQWPPVARACEHCAGEDLPWTRLSGRGRLMSWCTFERAYYPELPIPWTTIVVELDEGPFLISNPAGFDTDAAALGRPVEVRFVDCEDGAARFRLPVFALREQPSPVYAGASGE